jgi:predicted Zn finger-like uncharacterized protein
MILTCPNCGTQYVVKDGAIPPQGRQVRCASCKHSWHQDPEVASEEVAPAADDVHDEAAPENESFAEATLIEPRSGPAAEERAYEEAMVEGEPEPTAAQTAPTPQDQLAQTQAERTAAYAAEQRAQAISADFETADAVDMAPASDWNAPPVAEAADDEFSPFASSDAVEPRRRSPITTVLIVVLAVALLAAAFYFLAPPDVKARLGLGAGTASQLAFIITHRDRQQLESGNQLVTVTGRVINPTAKEQQVPPIQVQLTNGAGKLVYSWTIDPPARTLAAGASTSFNSAEVNVPPGAEYLTIKAGSPRA